MSLRTAWKQPNNSPINRHGLIRLILHRKRMRHPHPRINKALIQHDGLLKVLPRNLILLTMKVISADHKPTNRMARIILDQVVCCVI